MADATYETLDVTLDDRGVAYVALNLPETRNALSGQMIADPYWGNKAFAGKPEEIRKCISCLVGCWQESLMIKRHMRCAINPAVGDERFVHLEPAETPQTIAVVGGGPGGMEAARIARVPPYAMAAIVLALAVFGSYSVQNSMNDVYVMFVLGVAMFFLERYGYSAAPLVLGLILGPIAEANFIQGSMIANATASMGAYFFTGALNLVLIGIVVASIGYSAWMELRSRRYTTKDDAVAKEESLT